MNLVITSIVLFILVVSFLPIYNYYIRKRKERIICLRVYIIEHFKDLFEYLPEYEDMVREFSKPVTKEYWINYCSRQKRIKQ